MKTLALIFCLFLVGFGTYLKVHDHNKDGYVLVAIGTLSFICISSGRSDRNNKLYDHDSFMNK